MAKRTRPLNPNRPIEHMEVIVIKEQLDDIASTIGGKMVGETRIPGLLDLVRELADKLADMIGRFEHAEKWRKDYKAALADNEARGRERRQREEERAYAAAQDKARIEADYARQVRISRNRTILAIVTGIGGFLASRIFEHFFPHGL
jgi:hypothetical protein